MNVNMSSIVKSARGVWADLVAKRLWPVAVGLVLLLIAIPVVLAKPAPKGSAPATPVAGTAGPAPLVASPASVRSNTGAAPVGGKYHDPFKQLHGPKAASTAAPTTGGTGDPGTGGGSADSAGGGSKHKSSTTKTVMKLKVRFGKAGEKRTVKEITPGAPLPATTNPLIVFLDFSKGDKGGKFLVSSDVTKTEGDGTKTCKPSKTICSELTVQEGGTQFFDLANGDQYQLDVLDVVLDAA